MSCPVCQELLRRAREEASVAALTPRALDFIVALIVALATFWAAAWGTAAMLSTGTSSAPRTTGVVEVDCAREQDLCSTLLSAGVVAAGDAEEE